MKKILFCSLVLSSFAMTAAAQSGTNSPYSQFGMGVLSDQSQGFNRGMNGLSMGLRYSNQVNFLNPASYSAVDSLTMIFDIGLSGQVTNFTENGRKLNANNSNFEYIVASFRALPRLGVSAGMVPFTNVGYNYSNVENVGSSTTSSTTLYSGSGGVHQAFLGLGYKVWRGLSVGANLSYFWGSTERSIYVTNSDKYVNTVSKSYSSSISSYKLDLGVQWEQPLREGDNLVVGATYSLGHRLNGNADMTMTTLNNETAVSKTVTETVEDAYSLPHAIAVGATWQHGRSLTLGLDYSWQKWGSLDTPETDIATGKFISKSGLLKDRHKLTIGGEWVPNPVSRYYFKRVHYRFGASANTPYIKVNGQDGPKEYSVSAGFGFPISNSYNNRSLLNISGQWVHAAADGLITENTYRINIGITFNERWFMKWKVK